MIEKGYFMVDKMHITWEEFHQHTKHLAQKIKNNGDYNKIIAISRGGLIPAGIIAYELDIRDTQAINISSYDGEKQRQLGDIKIDANVGDVDEKTLVVDDLSDTGTTFKLIRQLFPKATLAAVYAKPVGLNYVDVYSLDIPDKWIVFPWDI